MIYDSMDDMIPNYTLYTYVCVNILLHVFVIITTYLLFLIQLYIKDNGDNGHNVIVVATTDSRLPVLGACDYNNDNNNNNNNNKCCTYCSLQKGQT